jgi:TPR repeat protein
MLPRTFGHTKARTSSIVPLTSCTSCQCRCGRPLSPKLVVPGFEQRRGASKAWRSPYTKRKQGDDRYPDVTPGQLAERQRLKEEKQHLERKLEFFLIASIEQDIRKLKMAGELDCNEKSAYDFIAECGELGQQIRSSRAKIKVASKEEFLALTEKYNVSEQDVLVLAIKILLRMHDEYCRQAGRFMISSASVAGNEGATLRVMHNVWLGSKDQKQSMFAPEVEIPRKHLLEIAEKGTNFRAMTLAGKIYQEYVGDKDAAIELWTKAVPPALAEARTRRGPVELAHLARPWQELAKAHADNNDQNYARDAFEAGIEVDDPNSHYLASKYHRHEQSSGEYRETSLSLYHLTKAASSGNVEAMHRLGFFYAKEPWPYLADEPPDSIKPTAFDRYPRGSKDNLGDSDSVLDGVQIGFSGSSERSAAVVSAGRKAAGLFHTATFPNTTEQRLRMALAWFKVAMDQCYGPSYFAAARLYLEQSCPDLSVPEIALSLSEQRYGRNNSQQNHVKPIVNNPLYAPKLAKPFISEIFHAAKALSLRKQYLKKGGLVQQKDGKKVTDFDQIQRDMPLALAKWFRYPDVYPEWMDQSSGVLYDNVGNIGNLEAEVRRICDSRGWHIYAQHDGGLLYAADRRKRDG